MIELMCSTKLSTYINLYRALTGVIKFNFDQKLSKLETNSTSLNHISCGTYMYQNGQSKNQNEKGVILHIKTNALDIEKCSIPSPFGHIHHYKP
jgi:hypothetical protein